MIWEGYNRGGFRYEMWVCVLGKLWDGWVIEVVNGCGEGRMGGEIEDYLWGCVGV